MSLCYSAFRIVIILQHIKHANTDMQKQIRLNGVYCKLQSFKYDVLYHCKINIFIHLLWKFMFIVSSTFITLH